MKITEQGIFDIPASAYHADPAPTPSLSSSIAKVMIAQSPHHAWCAHPRLGGTGEETGSRRLDLGSIAHELLLGKGRGLKIIDAKDYKGGTAKSERDLARAAGLIPALIGDVELAERMVKVARHEIGLNTEVAQVFKDPLSFFERSIFWKESGIWCRAMLDATDDTTVCDYKTVTNASPDYVSRHIYSMQYHVQHAWYLRGLNALHPSKAGRRKFIFIFQEIEPPHAVTFFRLDGAGEAMGERLCDQAVALWRECSRQNKWPGYDRGIHYAQLPGWMESSILAKEIERDERKRRPGEFDPQILLAG